MGWPPSSPTLGADPVVDPDSPSGLAHEPFFSALASLEGREDSAEWRATVAGLVVLRVVDRRIDHPIGHAVDGPGGAAVSELSDLPSDLLDATQQAVDAVDQEHPVGPSVRALLQAAAGSDPRMLMKCLIAYAQTLHTEAHWSLAADAYRTALRLADAPWRDWASDPAVAPFVYDRLGRSLRMMGDIDGAMAAYAAARAVANAVGDWTAAIRIRIGEAKVIQHLGNLPAAAATLDAIIADLDTGGDSRRPLIRPRLLGHSDLLRGYENEDLRAIARHDRGAIATDQGDLGLAIEHYFAAWRAYRDPAQRERVWIDMACTLGDLGLRDAARDAHVALHKTARRHEVRLLAAANLLELAVLDERYDDFLLYQRELTQAAALGLVPVRLGAWVALFEAQGEMCFGDADKATAALTRTLAFASQHRVNEVVIRADRALAQFAANPRLRAKAPVAVAESLSPGVQHVARVVRRIRRRAGTGQPRSA